MAALCLCLYFWERTKKKQKFTSLSWVSLGETNCSGLLFLQLNPPLSFLQRKARNSKENIAFCNIHKANACFPWDLLQAGSSTGIITTVWVCASNFGDQIPRIQLAEGWINFQPNVNGHNWLTTDWLHRGFSARGKRLNQAARKEPLPSNCFGFRRWLPNSRCSVLSAGLITTSWKPFAASQWFTSWRGPLTSKCDWVPIAMIGLLNRFQKTCNRHTVVRQRWSWSAQLWERQT